MTIQNETERRDERGEMRENMENTESLCDIWWQSTDLLSEVIIIFENSIIILLMIWITLSDEERQRETESNITYIYIIIRWCPASARWMLNEGCLHDLFEDNHSTPDIVHTSSTCIEYVKFYLFSAPLPRSRPKRRSSSVTTRKTASNCRNDKMYLSYVSYPHIFSSVSSSTRKRETIRFPTET